MITVKIFLLSMISSKCPYECICFRGDDFRPTYKSLGQLRAHVSSQVRFMCLTGTITNKGRCNILTSLHFNKPVTISMPIRRPNIHLSFQNVNSNDFSVFNHIIESIASESCPKTIIYCRNVKSVAFIYELFCSKLGLSQFKDCEPTLENRAMAMFHRSTDEVNKSHVLKDFPKVNTALRVVIAMSALVWG